MNENNQQQHTTMPVHSWGVITQTDGGFNGRTTQHPKAKPTQCLKATLAAFGPGEAISFTQDTWAKIYEAMSVLIEQQAQQQEAMKLALAIMERINKSDEEQNFLSSEQNDDLIDAIDAMTKAIKKAESDPKQRKLTYFEDKMAQTAQQHARDAVTWTPETGYVFKEQPTQPQQEPVAWILKCGEQQELWWEKPPFGEATPLYTSPPAQRKPLKIGKEAAAFKTWFDAWWVGDGELCKAVTTEVEQSNSYKSLYTLAFGAWMAAKEAAYGTKRGA